MGDWLTLRGDVEACLYRPGERCRHELLVPTQELRHAAVDHLHHTGARRSGWLFYRNDCRDCSSCVPLRVPVAGFQPSRSQRRVWRRNQDLTVRVGEPQVCAERVALYNRHQELRGLRVGDEVMEPETYRRWLTASRVETVEMSYWEGERLLGIGIVDLGERDASSVYFYFEPDADRRSLGTYSLLYELDWLAQRGLRYHYLGFTNADCNALRYKANFGPHQRLVPTPGGHTWLDSPSS